MATNEDPIATQQATPLLRQISEPHPQVDALEPDGEDGQDKAVPAMRRLTSNYLVELVRNANTSWPVTKPVAEACERELRTVCSNEMRLMQTAYNAVNGQWNAPFVEECLRNMNLCLATNSDALSSSCMDAMVTVFLNAPRIREPSPTAMWQPLPTGAALGEGDNTKGKRHGGHKMRHHKHEDDSSDDAKRVPQGLGIYVVNNNGGDPASNGNVIGMWGSHDRHDRHRQHHHHGTHPLVWMVLLPFFCVGVFVTVKHAIAYIKKRHGGSLPFARPSHEYEPLKVPDSPTQ